MKEAASFGQPITEYDPGSRGYKDFLNLARELMGNRPVESEPTSDTLSRPAELVQRAKQLAQLTNLQFGKNTVAPPSGVLAAPIIPSFNFAPSAPTAAIPTISLSSLDEDEADDGAIAPRFIVDRPVESAPPAKTTAQKIAEFYGVKQVGGEVIFAARFDAAKKVLIAGDFNNWSPMSTPMINRGRPGEFWMCLPLRPGRYRYRFVVDGKWMTDPNNSYVEVNQFGELNNVIEVD